MGRMSKDKGSQFERDICKALSLWVSKGARRDLFWRSSQSGGRATSLFKRGELLATHAGDIAAIDPLGSLFASRFFVECKRYKSLHLETLFYGDKGVLADFWRTTCQQAHNYKQVPVLIVKENFREELMFLPNVPLGWGVGVRAAFPSLFVYPLEFAFKMDIAGFFSWGAGYASSTYSRPTPNRPRRGRVSLDDLPVDSGAEIRYAANPRRPNRRERLSFE